MSAPRQISPLLDGCIVADAISSRGGISCYPVLRDATNERYILKVISVPHSPSQVAALLLSGTCKDRDDAAEYFLEASKNVVREKIILNNLSKAEGFFPYEFVQAEPKEDGIGYDVYLMTPYRRSAERLLKNAPTHLSAMNLALDLCTALAACRRAGYLYVDLKPSNVFFTDEQGFRIGDLGFVALDTLSSTPLAEKYQSIYSPAEVKDPMAVLNETVDTYALGMILYQVYNGGQLPAENEAMTPPAFADYELAEIIMKACAEKPEDRWQSPAALGRALVSYVQRNSINDTPIVPVSITEAEPELPEESEAVEEFLPEAEPEPEELAAVEVPAAPEAPAADTKVEIAKDVYISEETSEILAQADALLAELEGGTPAPAREEAPAEEAAEEITEEAPAPAPKAKKPIRWDNIILGVVIALFVLAAGLIVRQIYRTNNVRTVHYIMVTEQGDDLTVTVFSDIDDNLLTVICNGGEYSGKALSAKDGVVVLEDISPNTKYTFTIQITGDYKLEGKTSTSYTTDAE